MAVDMETKSPLIAVDTNVLMDLADDNEDAKDAIETIRKRIPGAVLIVTPTVVEELAKAADDDSEPKRQALALKAAQNMIGWGIRPLDFKPVGHGINEEIGRRIREAGLLPEEEVNDSYVIAEAALAECRMLISADAHIKDICHASLGAVLTRCDVPTPLIISPWKVVNRFFQKK